MICSHKFLKLAPVMQPVYLQSVGKRERLSCYNTSDLLTTIRALAMPPRTETYIFGILTCLTNSQCFASRQDKELRQQKSVITGKREEGGNVGCTIIRGTIIEVYRAAAIFYRQRQTRLCLRERERKISRERTREQRRLSPAMRSESGGGIYDARLETVVETFNGVPSST